MPRAGKLKVKGGRNIDYYDLAVRQFQQQILPQGMPATTVWGYGPRTAQGGPVIFNAPLLTIEAKHGTPVRVRWTNELRADPADPTSPFLPHLLPVGPTLHWANPPGGTMGRDMSPKFARWPESCTGPVPIVTHVHGAGGVGDESDGYAEAWCLPAGWGRPGRICERTGIWDHFFRGKAASRASARPTRAGEEGMHGLPVPEQPARVDDLVSRPHPRYDQPRRVYRAGQLLHGRGGLGRRASSTA